MITSVIENIEECAILDTVKEHYDSDYAFSVRIDKGFGRAGRWSVVNCFGGLVATYSPESKIFTMLI